MPYPAPIPVPPYPVFMPGAPVIPKLYYDAITPEQQIHKLCQELHKLCEYSNTLAEALNLDHEIIDKLEADFTTFMESGFDDYYQAQVSAWISANLEQITQQFTQKSVYFGLTSDGYFCAYIPESWNDIQFDTGMVYGRSDYGRLILRFASDGSGVIDNTYGYSLAQGTDVEALIRDLEVVTNRSDETYDAVFTNMDEVVPHVV